MNNKGLVLAISLALTANVSMAESEAVFAPIFTDNSYTFQPTASIMFGGLGEDIASVSDESAFGAEISINCPLLKTPTNRIRQQLSFVTSEDNDVELTSIELNPHYMFDMGNGIEAGFGPGIGLVTVDVDGDDDTVLAFQLGASATYRQDMLFAGVELRHQFTQDARINGNEADVDNARLMFKAGINF